MLLTSHSTLDQLEEMKNSIGSSCLGSFWGGEEGLFQSPEGPAASHPPHGGVVLKVDGS